MTADATLEQRGVDTIRGLAMDAVARARSGHTGTAMALAPLAHVLFTRVMRYDSSAPNWFDRDRFVLSAGHASMLQYAALYLTGFDLDLDDIRDFRQWDSLTPGHPEYGHTPGVEVTTGPLGQGFANAVGFALAERWLRARLGAEVCDHRVFAIASDGDLMEGVSHEAASLAGHQRLDRLTVVYDDNHVTIDGPSELSLSDSAARRFEAYGWDVYDLGEAANDLDAIEDGLRQASVGAGPALVILRSHIGWPMPSMTDAPAAHGAITDPDEIRAAKSVLGLDPEREFQVDEDVLAFYRERGTAGSVERTAWESRLDGYAGDRDELARILHPAPHPGWEDKLPRWSVGEKVATRVASNECLDAVAEAVPGLVAGGADLTGNTGTKLDAVPMSAESPGGRLLYYGVREHAMGSIMTGMALHGLLPVGGTFLVFSDYMRPAVRLAALCGAPVVYSFSHDSIGVGEDGPTHQPIEHVAALRAIPGLRVIRPADANEVADAWKLAVAHRGPTALVLTRQSVPVLAGTDAGLLDRGAYVLGHSPEPEVVLLGTGSEVQLCVEAAGRLGGEGIRARVVSMPCMDLFEAQPADYRRQVLPGSVPTVAVEAGTSFGWDRYAQATVCIDRFGASAPGDVAMTELGFTVENVVRAARDLLEVH